jgi:HUS1 checkpoint protein
MISSDTRGQDSILDSYTIQSAASNVINLEVPLGPLNRALKSAIGASSASIRLTKKDNIPLLSLTIVTNTPTLGTGPTAFGGHPSMSMSTANNQDSFSASFLPDEPSGSTTFDLNSRERETIITQDVPVRVLSQANVAGIHEPRCREPDVHIILPNLMQLKSISDRFTKLALASPGSSGATSSVGPRLELSANMHGCLRVAIQTDALKIQSCWTGLQNPELDPSQYEGGEEGVAQHPSTRMRQLGDREGKSEEGWAKVRIDGRDWGKVMSVGRLGGRVIACESFHNFRSKHEVKSYLGLKKWLQISRCHCAKLTDTLRQASATTTR